MLTFLKHTWPAVVMVFFAIANEFVMGWLDMPFKEVVTYGDVSYHFVIKVGYLSLLPSIILYFKEENKDAKIIYLGLIFWNIKEIIDRLHYVAENKICFINESLFFSISKNDVGFIFQVFNITLVVLFSILTYKKCILFFRFLLRLCLLFWRGLLYIRKKSKRN